MYGISKITFTDFALVDIQRRVFMETKMAAVITNSRESAQNSQNSQLERMINGSPSGLSSFCTRVKNGAFVVMAMVVAAPFALAASLVCRYDESSVD